MPYTLAPFHALRYRAERRGDVVGYELKLVVRLGETVTVAVLVRDHRGHFIAVTPMDLGGEAGVGIIDLNTAMARFARSYMPGWDNPELRRYRLAGSVEVVNGRPPA